MGVTINECQSLGHKWVERHYTDNDLRELFDDDAECG